MSSQDAAINIALRLVDQASAPMNQAMAMVERSTNAAERQMRMLGNTVRMAMGAFAGLGLSLGISEIIKTADTWNNLHGRLKLVTESTAQLADVEQRLFGISQNTRQGYEQTADLYARIARSTQEMNLGQEKTLTITDTINKSLIVSGTSSASANAAIIQLGQGFASGVLRGEELNSVLEQAPRLAQAIAEGMGITVGQLRAMGKEGKLTAEAVAQALVSQSAAVTAEFDKMPKTVAQGMTVMNNSLGRLISGLDNAKSFTAQLAGKIIDLASHLDTAAKNTDLLTSGLATAGKIALAAGGLAALPAVVAGASTAILSLRFEYEALLLVARTGGITSLITTPLWGVSVAAQAATGWIGKLKIAGGVMFAAFAGWEIGKWLSDNFETARIAGILMVDNLIAGFYRLQHAAKIGWAMVYNPASIGDVVSKANATLKAQLSAHREIMAGMSASPVAKALAANPVAKSVEDKTSPPPDPAAEAAAKKHAAALDSVLKRLLPLRAEQQEYEADLKLLDELLGKHRITTGEYGTALDNLTKTTAEYKEAEDAVTESVKRFTEANAEKYTRLSAQMEQLNSLQDELTETRTLAMTDEQRQIDSLYNKYARAYEVVEESVDKLDMTRAEADAMHDMLGVRMLHDMDALKDKTDDLSQFQIQAYRNMQDSGASFLESMRSGNDDYLDNFVQMTLKMVDQWASAQLMMSLLGEDFSKGGKVGGAAGTAVGAVSSAWNDSSSWLGAVNMAMSNFADGGIMTSGGSLPLHRYASGGIADTPQLAMFGEGRTPEAYVPLPDGRSIPVTMKGGGSGGVTIHQSITVEIDARGADAGVEQRISVAAKEAAEEGAQRGYRLVIDEFRRGLGPIAART